MAIISEWQTPLEDALEELLDSRDLSFANLEEIRHSLSILDHGSSRVSELSARLEQRVRQMDEAYQKAVLDAKNPIRDVVENAVSRLQQMDLYKNTSEKIQQGKERIKQLPQEAQQLKDRLQEKTSSLIQSAADNFKSLRSRFKR